MGGDIEAWMAIVKNRSLNDTDLCLEEDGSGLRAVVSEPFRE